MKRALSLIALTAALAIGGAALAQDKAAPPATTAPAAAAELKQATPGEPAVAARSNVLAPQPHCILR